MTRLQASLSILLVTSILIVFGQVAYYEHQEITMIEFQARAIYAKGSLEDLDVFVFELTPTNIPLRSNQECIRDHLYEMMPAYFDIPEEGNYEIVFEASFALINELSEWDPYMIISRKIQQKLPDKWFNDGEWYEKSL